MKIACLFVTVATLAYLLLPSHLVQAADVRLGNMQANRILFLGNSITSCPPKYWGLSATTIEKDYAHLLCAAINAKTGGHLALIQEVAPKTNPDGSVDLGDSNVINIADVFERGYASYDAAKIVKQLAVKPDIVILQFGENIPPATFNAELFTKKLKQLVNDIKENSNPQIFVAGYILGSNAAIDEIKRSVCAEDPARRMFVDLSSVGKDPSNIGDYGHPNDKGMALIADSMFKAVLARSAEAPDASKPANPVGKFYSVDPAQVEVGGEIGRRIDNTIRANLLALDVDNHFLKLFREKKNQPDGYIGIGKVIDSCVSFARYSKDPKVIEVKDRFIRELIATQLADGYIGLKPEGHRVTELWDLHEMVYIIHALVNDYRYFHNQASLDAARKLADFVLKNRRYSDPALHLHQPGHLAGDQPEDTGKLNTERAMIALSEATGDGRYRDYGIQGMNLRNWHAPVAGHAYTFMNICVSQLDLYREKPEESLLTQSRKVIDYLTKNDGLVITGTCSLGETFHNNQDLRGNLGESCATAYLIRMAHYLLQLEGRSLDGDIMERAIYNALFAAQEPTGRHLRYFTCAEGPRVYFDKDTYCCPGNWRRIVAEIPEMIYYRSADGGLLVNLYAASSANLKLSDNLSVQLRQETDYPNSGRVAITVEPSRQAEFPVSLRIPRWCQGATVSVNGQKIDVPTNPGDFPAIKRPWKTGDVLTLDMPMKTRLVRGRKLQAGKVALMRGPVVFSFSPSRQKDLPQLQARLSEITVKLGAANGDSLSLANIVAGGNGFVGGTPGYGINVLDGQPATGPANILAVAVNKFIPSNQLYVHGVVIPEGGKDGQTLVPISATGLTASVPATSGKTWDHVRSGPVASQHTSVVSAVDYSKGPHTMLSMHANKAVTFDIAAVRKTTSYGEIRFHAKVCYGGQSEPTVDYAVLVDGKPIVARKAVTREPQEIDVSLPVESRFLTLIVTDQNSDISHDQVFFGDAVLTPVGFKPGDEAVQLVRERQAVQAKLAQYPAAQGKIKFDAGSLNDVILDKAVRPDGQMLQVRTWGTNTDRTKPADLNLSLTEYADPAGELTYFTVDDPQIGIEDELFSLPDGTK